MVTNNFTSVFDRKCAGGGMVFSNGALMIIIFFLLPFNYIHLQSSKKLWYNRLHMYTYNAILTHYSRRITKKLWKLLEQRGNKAVKNLRSFSCSVTKLCAFKFLVF